TVFSLMGQFVQTEVKSVEGRADAVVKTSDAVYVFEFKLDNGKNISRNLAAALKQIDEKGYLIPYQSEGKKLVKIGATFNKNKGILTRWKIISPAPPSLRDDWNKRI
ncbi:MAG: PD-(D/E)XK nuclease domain-containing protein, partial [Dysgonamonadaceae bacterium]|nr:PD-(D/E)XK nuclease domain-containing protein [Dysgonamonadaceae bacterium]